MVVSPPELSMPTAPPTPDPRVGLKAGRTDAGEAIWNMRLVSNTPSSEGFVGVTNSDLAFLGNYVIQGNYNGPVIWDISNPAKPELVVAFTCPASQNDVWVYRNLMFVSAQANDGHVDCLPGTIPEPVSAKRVRGVRMRAAADQRVPARRLRAEGCDLVARRQAL